MSVIDLNSDLGESFGAWRMGLDEEVMPHITSANVACGWHAGDAGVMNQSVQSARQRGVGVGAHPGYPDLLGFGRRQLGCSPQEVHDYIAYQVGALGAFCRIHGVRLAHVKPHGRLYLDCLAKEDLCRAAAEAVAAYGPELIYVTLAGPGGDLASRLAREAGLKVAREAFPDRAYTPDGVIVSIVEGGAIHDPREVAERAVRVAAEQKLVAIDGTVIDLDAHTLCVHGDTPLAVDFARDIRGELARNGVEVAPMTSFVR